MHTSKTEEKRVSFETKAGADTATTWKFTGVALELSYTYDGFESPALVLKTRYPGEKKPASSMLFQLVVEQPGDLPQRPQELAGGSFTGLHTAFIPDSNAELRYSCTAR